MIWYNFSKPDLFTPTPKYGYIRVGGTKADQIYNFRMQYSHSIRQLIVKRFLRTFDEMAWLQILILIALSMKSNTHKDVPLYMI